MEARRKLRTVHRDAYGNTLDATLRCNGLDLYDGATATAARPNTTKPVTGKQVADRYALMAEAETRRVYREFRRRQVAFKAVA